MALILMDSERTDAPTALLHLVPTCLPPLRSLLTPSNACRSWTSVLNARSKWSIRECYRVYIRFVPIVYVWWLGEFRL